MTTKNFAIYFALRWSRTNEKKTSGGRIEGVTRARTTEWVFVDASRMNQWKTKEDTWEWKLRKSLQIENKIVKHIAYLFIDRIKIKSDKTIIVYKRIWQSAAGLCKTRVFLKLKVFCIYCFQLVGNEILLNINNFSLFHSKESKRLNAGMESVFKRSKNLGVKLQWDKWRTTVWCDFSFSSFIVLYVFENQAGHTFFVSGV